ncbi:MAG: hypothetical protein WCG27_10130, partial [Pseudomonadota bacterium]
MKSLILFALVGVSFLFSVDLFAATLKGTITRHYNQKTVLDFNLSIDDGRQTKIKIVGGVTPADAIWETLRFDFSNVSIIKESLLGDEKIMEKVPNEGKMVAHNNSRVFQDSNFCGIVVQGNLILNNNKLDISSLKINPRPWSD